MKLACVVKHTLDWLSVIFWVLIFGSFAAMLIICCIQKFHEDGALEFFAPVIMAVLIAAVMICAVLFVALPIGHLHKWAERNCSKECK
jgi:fatty acid desaturase